MLKAIRAAMTGKKTSNPAYWGLCFTALEDNSTVKFVRETSDSNDWDLSYSFDGKKWSKLTTWYKTSVQGTTVTLANAGDHVFIAAKEGVTNVGNLNSVKRTTFEFTGKIAASGNLNSMFNRDIKDMIGNCASLFAGCSQLYTAPELPATTLTTGCYQQMFEGCSNLVMPPELPAIELADSCYSFMFYRCSKLAVAPRLPAATLTPSCYSNMFDSCSSLENAPELPATTLASRCYSWMFNGGWSLSAPPPELPALSLTHECYHGMFYGCEKMTDAPKIKAAALSTYCCEQMFTYCESLSAITLENLSSWATTASNTFTNWVSGVADTGTFYCLSSLGTDATITRGTSFCPQGWTVENTIPA